MAEDGEEIGQRRELRASVQRLSRILLDRLEQGTRDGSLDQGQIRLLASLELRSLRLWRSILGMKRGSEDEMVSSDEAGLVEKLERIDRRVED